MAYTVQIDNGKEARRALGNMRLFYDILAPKTQTLLGILEIYQFDSDPDLTSFLKAEKAIVNSTPVDSSAISVLYGEDEKEKYTAISYTKISFFLKFFRKKVRESVHLRFN